MSRCYPYPPPGYALRRSSEEGLVKSIKLQTGTEKTKDGKRKEKRRENKERNNEKDKRIYSEGNNKHAAKLGKPTSSHSQTDSMAFSNKQKSFFPKAKEVERELLERSSLTEEHNLPVSMVGPSTSSDSTENSKKRKIASPPEDVTRPRGKVIRIKLQPKKQIGPISAPVNEQKELLSCSEIGTVHMDKYARAIESRDNVCSTSGRKGGLSSIPQNYEAVAATPLVKTEPPTSVPKLSPVLTALQREQLLYANLFEKLAPPPNMQQDSYIEEDLDWLSCSAKKHNVQASATTRRCGNDTVVACSSSVLQPRAQYLPEVDIFALPFTIPF